MSNFENIIEQTSQLTILDKLNFVDKVLNDFYFELEQMTQTQGVDHVVEFLDKIKNSTHIQNYFSKILKVFEKPTTVALTETEIQKLFSLLEETFLGKKLENILSSIYDKENADNEEKEFDFEHFDEFSDRYYVSMTWAENLYIILLNQIKENDLKLIASNKDLLSSFLGVKNIQEGNQHWVNFQYLELEHVDKTDMVSSLFQAYIDYQKSQPQGLGFFSNPEKFKNDDEIYNFSLFIEWCFESAGFLKNNFGNKGISLAETFLMNLKNIPPYLIEESLKHSNIYGVTSVVDMLSIVFYLMSQNSLKENEPHLSNFIHYALNSIKPHDFDDINYLYDRHHILRNVLGSDNTQEFSYEKTMKTFLKATYLFSRIDNLTKLLKQDDSLDCAFFIDCLTDGFDLNSIKFKEEICTVFLQRNMEKTIKSLSDLLLSRKDLAEDFKPTLLSWLKISTEEILKPDTFHSKSFFIEKIVDNLDKLFPMVKDDFEEIYSQQDLKQKIIENVKTTEINNLDNNLQKDIEKEFNQESEKLALNLINRFKGFKM